MRGATFPPIPPFALPLSRIHPSPRSGFPLSFAALSLSHKYPQVINLVLPHVPLLSLPLSVFPYLSSPLLNFSKSYDRVSLYHYFSFLPSYTPFHCVEVGSLFIWLQFALLYSYTYPCPTFSFPFLSSLFLFPISSANISKSYRRFIPPGFPFSLPLQRICPCPVMSYFPIGPFLPLLLSPSTITFLSSKVTVYFPPSLSLPPSRIFPS